MYSDFGAQENKVCHCFHCFHIYLPWSDGTGWHHLCFRMLSFKPAFSLSSFTLIKRLFSSSLLPAITVVSSAYLRLLIFLLPILIQACAPSSPAFCMMYSVCKLSRVTIYSLNILLSQSASWFTCKNTFIIRRYYLFNVLTGLFFPNTRCGEGFEAESG